MKQKFSRVLAVVVTVLILVPAAGLAQNAAKPFAWKAESGNGSVVLVGSIHVAKPEMYPLDPRIEGAFSDAESLAVEVDVGNQAAGLMQQMLVRASYPPGDGLSAHISPAVLKQVDARLQKYGMGVAMLNQFKPWMVAQTIAMTELAQLGYQQESGIDMHFLKLARGKKKILELEKAEDQLSILDGMSEKEQEMFLVYTLKDLDQMHQHLDDLFLAWKGGDAGKMEEFLTQSIKDSPELAQVYEKLINDRNKTMTEKIDGYLKTGGKYFVVVGAAHLIGDKGIVNLLRQSGYQVNQLE